MTRSYEPISRRFHQNADHFADVSARVWFKLLHRDLRLKAVYLGPEATVKDLISQNPIPSRHHALIDAAEIDVLKAAIMITELSTADLVSLAWALGVELAGGADRLDVANGARIRLTPQKDWPAQPVRSTRAIGARADRAGRRSGRVQCGADRFTGRPDRAGGGGRRSRLLCWPQVIRSQRPFTHGRMDATAERTDAASFDPLEPEAHGFRTSSIGNFSTAAQEILVDRGQFLILRSPEMMVLFGGVRVAPIIRAARMAC